MKDIYFCQLEENDDVWVVYNKNYDTKNSFYEPILVRGHIIENREAIREYDVSDSRYEEPCYRIDHEHYIKISVEGLSIKYHRYYSDTYNEKGQMIITPEYNDYGPDIEIFSTKDKAKEYLISWCERTINRMKERIDESQKEMEVNINCINKIKDI